MVGNLTKIWGNHTCKFGIDVRRAYNLRVPSDQHRSGELTFNATAHAATPASAASASRRSCSATSNAPRVRALRQHEHRRARAAVAALLLRAGHLARQLEADAELRPAARRHQPADGQRGRQRRLGRPRPPARDLVGGVGDIDLAGNVENRLNWAPRLGADLSAERQDGHPRRLRPQLRHRRLRLALRPHRHPEPAGAGGAEHERARASSTRSSTSPRGRRRRSSCSPAPTARSCWPNGIKPLVAAAQAAAARGGRLERHRAAPAERHDVGRGRLRRQLRRGTCSPATTRTTNLNQVDARRVRARASSPNLRRPFFAGGVTPNVLGVGGNFGWTQTVQAYPQRGAQLVQGDAGEVHPALQRAAGRRR